MFQNDDKGVARSHFANVINCRIDQFRFIAFFTNEAGPGSLIEGNSESDVGDRTHENLVEILNRFDEVSLTQNDIAALWNVQTNGIQFHVAVLPGLATLLLILHLLLVQKLGISSPPKVEAEHARKGTSIPQMPFFPNFFLRELMAWYAALGVLGSLAAIFPWELGDKADPFASAPAGIRPEWYFLAPFYTLKLLPSHGNRRVAALARPAALLVSQRFHRIKTGCLDRWPKSGKKAN